MVEIDGVVKKENENAKPPRKKKKKKPSHQKLAPDVQQHKVQEMRSWRQTMKDARKNKKLQIRQDGNLQHQQAKTGVDKIESKDGGQILGKDSKAKSKRKLGSDSKDEARPAKKKMKSHDVASDPAADTIVEDPEAYKVVVAGMPTEVEDNQIRLYFQRCGEVLNVRLLRDRDTRLSRGIAFVSFTSKQARDKALGLDGDKYSGRELLIQVAKDSGHGAKGKSKGTGALSQKPDGCTSIIVKGLAYSVSESDLMDVFKSCGNGPSNVKVLTDKASGKSRGMAFIDFESQDAIDAAMSLAGSELKGRRFSTDYATPREKSAGPGTKPPGCTSVLVKGLAYSVIDQDLRKVFKSCGAGPTNVRMVYDKDTGNSRGMAFVDFESTDIVDQAMKFHGHELNGRCFIMDYAVKEADKHSNPKKKPLGCKSVVIRNLASSVTENRLLKVFKDCGDGPKNVNLVTNDNGESKCMAFVNFFNEDSVVAAMEFNGAEYKGNCFEIEYVKPKVRKTS